MPQAVRHVRAKTLIINAFALTWHLAVINPYTQSRCPELCAYWALPFRYALVTFAPVSTNAIISPLALHTRWSLKAWPLRHYADKLKRYVNKPKNAAI